MAKKRKCLECKKTLPCIRNHGRYCGVPCRMRAYRRRSAAGRKDADRKHRTRKGVGR